MSAKTSFRSAVRVSARASLFGLALLPLAGCSTFENLNPFAGEKYETKILPDVPADDIYNQGVARLQNKDTEGATKKFGQLEKDFAYSDYARKGLLMQTYAQYQGGSYDDAIESGARYYKLYPNTPDAPYALYLQAMSYYSQVPDISRDQAQAGKALALFEEIVTKYPNSEYANDSKYKIQVTRDQLAGKEMSVGRFYLARKNYTAAINRFREVLAKYQTTRHTEEALMRLTEAYMGLGITDEAQTAAAILGHNFPDSEWYKDSFALLKDNGLEPHENQDSWISKAFRKIGLT
ncbi:outer membrane protein assembly factor BamD [Lichenifustis flavocetrariae]|uniref:Outer membrane protein assembly factor BamD n=1 Tax=Lichenifustis flavocetrariae TaxID=2949735 RepID=A0AA41YZQ6_9HYPH|nr:outer membrane protein assembly factor BamD [Lichenifustis flavocetrariae]MCW6511109.1 outer membrane protein assembly factor BamD [Lichenifustis flavocetrariae]